LVVTLILAVVGLPVAWAQGMLAPVRITEGETGQLLVSDYVGGAIYVVDKQSARVLSTVNIEGSPVGIARMGKQIFVGNRDTQAVEVYELDSKKGKARMLRTLGPAAKGKKAGFFNNPTDIAIDPALGQVFVLDTGDQLVKVFDVAGNLITSFAPAVTGQQVTFVAAIAVDVARQEVLVSDQGIPYGTFGGPAVAARILFFNYAGVYLRQINGSGYVPSSGNIAETQFTRPQGLVTDDAGHVFMVDAVLGELFIFDQNNVVDQDNVAVDSRLGSGQLKGPTDVALDVGAGDVFVVNGKLGRIEVFREAGRIP
jgi:DNA-binding beta-propeller fold protein YncE